MSLHVTRFPEVLLAAQMIFTSRGWGRVDDRGEVDAEERVAEIDVVLKELRTRHFGKWYAMLVHYEVDKGPEGVGSYLSGIQMTMLEEVLSSIMDGALRIAFTTITRN